MVLPQLMNPASDTPHPPPGSSPGNERGREISPPSNWREALPALIASRIALIQIESREAAKQSARRAVGICAAAVCAFFAWALLIAGSIAAISDNTGWPWHWVAMAAAAIHLLAAIVLARFAKTAGGQPFPVTRAEFQKDREWIETLKKTPKSNA